MFKLSRSQWVSVAILISSLGLAAAVTIPNVFTSGTSISSSQVNANFSALGTAVTAAESTLANIRMIAKNSGAVNSGTATSAAATLLNFTAPSSGNMLYTLNFTCASFSGASNTRWDIFPVTDGLNGPRQMVLFFPNSTFSPRGDSATISQLVSLTQGAHTFGYSATQNGTGSLDCNITASGIFFPSTITVSSQDDPQPPLVGQQGADLR